MEGVGGRAKAALLVAFAFSLVAWPSAAWATGIIPDDPVKQVTDTVTQPVSSTTDTLST